MKGSDVMERRIRIGTRGSALALAQTNQVIQALHRKFPEVETETVILRTQGDKILEKPLLSFGGKGVFVTEFEEALQRGQIDLAVHSAKDMPMELADSLTLAGVLLRADARDVLVTKRGALQEEQELAVGTGSLRRQFQLKKLFPQMLCQNIRGNVPTRLQKLRDGEYDGLVLAAAGLERLGLLEEEDLEYRFFSYDEMIPAGGQGIIAIEGRRGDDISRMAEQISDEQTHRELAVERKLLYGLNAGCQEAVGVISEYGKEQLRIRLIREWKGLVIHIDETAASDAEAELINKVLQQSMDRSKGRIV